MLFTVTSKDRTVLLSTNSHDLSSLNHTHLRPNHAPHVFNVKKILLVWLHLIFVIRVVICFLKVPIRLHIEVSHSIISECVLAGEALVGGCGVVLILVSALVAETDEVNVLGCISPPHVVAAMMRRAVRASRPSACETLVPRSLGFVSQRL